MPVTLVTNHPCTTIATVLVVETSTAARNRRGLSNGKAKELWPGLWELMKKHKNNFKVGSVFLATPATVFAPLNLPLIVIAAVTRTPSLDTVRKVHVQQIYDSLFEWFRGSNFPSISIAPIVFGTPATALSLLLDCWKRARLDRDLFIHCTESLLIDIPEGTTCPWTGEWKKIKTLNPVFEALEKP